MTDETNRKYGANTEGRNTDGTFSAHNPGKPKGARHKTTLAVAAMLDGEAEEITRKAIDMAKDGDMAALRLCLERIAPPRKDAPVSFDLPRIENAKDASKAAQAVLQAVSDGGVTPSEAAMVLGLVEQFRRTLETTDLEKRIEALEGDK